MVLFSFMLRLAAFAVQLLLSLFFLFVGGMKSFAPIPMLQIHHAWVADLPVAIARSVGVSEVACAAILLFGLFMRSLTWWAGIAAWSLVANQLAAVAFHVLRGEIAVSGAQNGLLILALVFIALHCRFAGNAYAASQQDTASAVD
jgi:hypothetical protein